MFFTIWVIFWNISRIYIFFFNIIFLKYFQSSFSDRKFIPSQLYSFLKVLVFFILRRSFFISSWFIMTVKVYWKHLLCFLLTGFIVTFCFLSNQENLCTIYHGLNLFYDIYNIITERNHYHYLWFNFFKMFLNWQCFISIIVTFVLNIIVTPKITSSYWLIIISSSSCSNWF